MSINMEILYALEKLRVPFMNYVMLAISIIGDLGSAVPAVLIFYWCISKRSGYFIMGNTMCGSGINAALKTWFHVERRFVAQPDFEIVDIDRSTAGGYAFPSGN